MAIRISIEKEDEILLLVSRHVSQRKIAELVGVARGTVEAYIHDKHKIARGEKPKPKTVGEIREPVVPKYRCQGCGNLVYYSPCQICSTARRKSAPERVAVRIDLDLRMPHRERYEALRAAGGGELIGCPAQYAS